MHLFCYTKGLLKTTASKGSHGRGSSNGEPTKSHSLNDRAISDIRCAVIGSVSRIVKGIEKIRRRSNKPFITKPAHTDPEIRSISRHGSHYCGILYIMCRIHCEFTRRHGDIKKEVAIPNNKSINLNSNITR